MRKSESTKRCRDAAIATACLAVLACSNSSGTTTAANGSVPVAGQPNPDVPADGPPGPAPMPAEEQPLAVGAEFSCDPAATSQPRPNFVTRLSGSEYANSIRDIFGVDVRDEARRLPDGLPTAGEFNNQSSIATREHADQFAAMARSIAAGIEPEALLEQYADGCDSYDAACRGSLLENLGRSVLRGPLVELERAALERVLSTAEAESVPFAEAVRYLVETLVQSPRFVYRIEGELGDGAVRELNGFEIASRLSFAVWGSTPDTELLELAGAGQLTTDDDVLGGQLSRMLADPRARERALEFFDDWMDLHRTEDASQVQERYPDFDEGLLADMREESLAAFAYVFDNGLPLSAIFNLDKTFITGRLAEHYGLENKGDGEYDLSQVPERAGLLTQASMASLGGADSSTVRRGLYFLGQVLCGTIEDPPPGITAIPTPPAPGVSVRQSSEERVGAGVCGSCHRQFEPLIWGLARFDVAGKYSAVDKFGNALPEDGWIIFPDDPETVHSYAGPAEMAQILGASTRVRDCAALKFRKYVSRQDAFAGDGCSLAAARQRLEQGSGSYQEIVAALVQAPNFRRLTTEQAGDSL
jgi:hypothetical protein